MKIAMIGSGAAGSCFASYLRNGGADITLVDRYKEHMDKMHVNASGDAFLDVTLTLDTDTRARFLLTDIVYMDPKGKSDFSLDEKSLSGDYVVTDLR